MNDDLSLPGPLSDWLEGKDDSTVFDDTASIDAEKLEKTLGEHDFSADLLDGEVSRAHLFELAEEAPFSAEASLNLLWNSLAWQTGPEDLPRIAAELDPGPHTSALMEAAALAGSDPTGAFRALNSGKRTIPGLGPELFTAYLYFAGGGAPEHPSLIFTDTIAGTLQEFDWEFSPGRAGEYARYSGLARVWAEEAGVERRDLIELGLASLG